MPEVPPASRFPSPPYSRSFSPHGYENPAIEEGDSREPVEEIAFPLKSTTYDLTPSQGD